MNSYIININIKKSRCFFYISINSDFFDLQWYWVISTCRALSETVNVLMLNINMGIEGDLVSISQRLQKEKP